MPSPFRTMNRPVADRCRALTLLAVYAIFALLPGAHLLWADHDGGHPSRSGERVVMTQGCEDGCRDPHHHHGDHDAEHCALCRLLGTRQILPPPVPTAVAATELRAVLPAPAPTAIDTGVHGTHRPRAPPLRAC